MEENIKVEEFNFYVAIAEAIYEINKISFKESDNLIYKSKYVKLEDLTDKVIPVLYKHKLFLEFIPWFDMQDMMGVECIIRNSVNDLVYRGGVARSSLFIDVTYKEKGDNKKTELLFSRRRTDQEIGSGFTYLRRYALCMLLGIVADEDDDGNSTSVEPVKLAEKQVKSQKSIEWLADLAGKELEDAKNKVINYFNNRTSLSEERRAEAIASYIKEIDQVVDFDFQVRDDKKIKFLLENIL